MAKSGATPVPVLEPLYGEFAPYTVEVTLRGLTAFLFNALHEYEEEDAGEAKTPRRAPADYEQMVWRCDDGTLGLPAMNVVASIVSAGRFFKSPIAARGSARNTLQESLMPASDLASFGVPSWDAIDYRIARYAGKSRAPKPTWRPRLEKGWQLTARFSVITPELYAPSRVLELVTYAGRICGVGDGRKIGLGRFAPDGFEVADGIDW